MAWAGGLAGGSHTTKGCRRRLAKGAEAQTACAGWKTYAGAGVWVRAFHRSSKLCGQRGGWAERMLRVSSLKTPDGKNEGGSGALRHASLAPGCTVRPAT